MNRAICETTRRHVPQDSHHNHCRKDVISDKGIVHRWNKADLLFRNHDVIFLETSECHNMAIPVASRPEEWVCGRSFDGTAGSNPAWAWMSVSRHCCVLSGRVICVGLITRPEEFYRVWCVWVIAKSRYLGGPDPLGAVAPWKKKNRTNL